MTVSTSSPAIQNGDWRRSGVASTSVEIVPAAAGIGRPMKYFLSVTRVWMLKRARRIEPHTTKRKDAIHPSR
jgi:hypothetical protein